MSKISARFCGFLSLLVLFCTLTGCGRDDKTGNASEGLVKKVCQPGDCPDDERYNCTVSADGQPRCVFRGCGFGRAFCSGKCEKTDDRETCPGDLTFGCPPEEFCVAGSCRKDCTQ